VYRVTCHACGKPFDAEKAPDCNCDRPIRSFRCPNCDSCFCDAPPDYAVEFWKTATPEIRARRGQHPSADHVNDPPELVPRPLVLFADDDPSARSIAIQVVKSLGLGIVIAADGETALQLARIYKPELLITDALMPKLDGREVALAVRQEMPQTKIIVITGVYKDRRYKEEAQRMFAVDEFLQKPLKPGDLRDLVRKYLA
jgi:CheY-like chemotaxis protein